MEENVKKKEADEDIVNLQKELVSLVAEMFQNKEICFTSVPAVGASGGYYWVPSEEISGKFILDNFEVDPNEVIETSKKVGDDYQKIIAEYFEKNPERRGNIFEEGKKWTLGKLLMWGGSIVEEGLMTHREIFALAKDFEKAIEQKGEDFFGYFHGNVIGDHIYVGDDKTPYLLGMRIVPRPGKGIYDFLRTLDWFILKADNEAASFNRIVGWMKKYLSEYGWEGIKLIFALRCIGILGWDILHRGDFGRGNTEKKKEILLKFIRREY